MIARMARENSARRNPGIPDIREAIAAAVQAHGAGKILPKEMEIKNPKMLRDAPAYPIAERAESDLSHPYTVEALARFLGFVKSQDRALTSNFNAAFGAAELIAEGHLKESQIKGF